MKSRMSSNINFQRFKSLWTQKFPSHSPRLVQMRTQREFRVQFFRFSRRLKAAAEVVHIRCFLFDDLASRLIRYHYPAAASDPLDENGWSNAQNQRLGT